MPACAILAIALVTGPIDTIHSGVYSIYAGPNSTRLRLVQFTPVTRAINAK